jgi:hypothetical protein
LAVARAVLQRGKFHKGMSRVSDDRGNLFYDGESPQPKKWASPGWVNPDGSL